MRIFLFPLAYSPGPGNLFFAANGARFGFWDGVVLLMLNPKAYVLMALMYSQFWQADALIWVATVFTLNNIVAFCLFALVGDRIAARFARGQSGEQANKAMALMLAAVAVWMLFL